MQTIPAEFTALQQSVQHNCHIADALHAGDYTMCVYLMRMRELYRWEKGYRFADKLPHEEVGDWLREREALWETLEATDFQPVRINGDRYAPFESGLINDHLSDHGLVYSAGLGYNNKAHFFLGRLHTYEQQQGFNLLVADQEYARDLTAPPAMTQGNTIFIRRESMRRMVFEKLEEWRWNKLDNPMGRAVACFDFDDDLEASLDRMTDSEINTLLQHELGEVKAGELLGAQWETMLMALPAHRTQLLVRMVRDNLADCLATLPALRDNSSTASLHFYMATLSNLRKHHFPALVAGYQHWHETGEYTFLEQAMTQGHGHWLQIAREALHLFMEQDAAAESAIVSLIEENPL